MPKSQQGFGACAHHQMDGLHEQQQLAVFESEEQQDCTITQNTQKIMAPYLDSMSNEIKANWPGMEPELMLLHWLCRRHKMELPSDISLARRPTSKTIQDAPEPRPPAAPPPTVSSPTRPGRTLTSQGEPFPEKLVNEFPNTLCKVDLSSRYMRCEEEGCDCRLEGAFQRDMLQSQGSPCLASRLRRRRDEAKIPVLKTLRQITDNVERDVSNLDRQSSQFKHNTDSIATHVATMRMELRGKFVANVPLLSLKVLSREEQFRLVGKLRPWNFETGDAIFSEGEIGDKLYIIEGGTCEIWKTIEGSFTRICNIAKGDFFGEIAVMYDAPRSATVLAATSVTLLSLSRQDLYATLDPSKVSHMKILARAQVFSNIPMFAKLGTATKVLISGKLRLDTYAEGSTILRENSHIGGDNRRLYIIETGQCLQSHKRADWHEDENPQPFHRKMSRTQQMKLHTVACQAGDYFAMLEFLYGCPQLQTLTAVTEVVTLSISYDEMKDLLQDQPDSDENFADMAKAVRIHLIRESHPSLKNLTAEECDIVEASVVTQTYEKYDTIFRKGEKMLSLTMLEQGRCIEYDGAACSLMELGLAEVECTEHTRPGETFGSSAILDTPGAPAPYTIVALSDKVHMVHISKAKLDALPRFKNSKCMRHLGARDLNALLPKI